jgi:hypothetical protein
MATYVIDPVGGGDYLTLAAAKAAGGAVWTLGNTFSFVPGSHDGGGVDINIGCTLVSSTPGAAELTRSSGSYTIQIASADKVRLEGMKVTNTGTCRKAINLGGTRKLELDGECVISLEATSGTSDMWGVYIEFNGNLITEPGCSFVCALNQYYHYCIWNNGGLFDMTRPIFDTHSRGIAIAANSTGTIDDAILLGHTDVSNNAFALYTEATTSVVVNKAKMIGFVNGVYKSSTKTSENKVQFNNCTVDHCTVAVYAKYGEVFNNCIVSNCGTAFYSPDALGHQDAPTNITWDGVGTLCSDYTAPTNLTTGDPKYVDADLHIAFDSAARGAGVAIVGLTLDSDGVLYEDPPSCGVYEANPPTTWILTYNAGANGSIDGDTPQIVIEGEDGTEVEAIPDEGYSFVEWDDHVATAARQDLAVMADLTVEASFEIKTYEIAVSLDWNDGGIVTGADTYDHGETVVLEAVANSGFVFAGWREGTEIVSLDAELTFEAVEARTFVALFISQEQADVTANGDWLWYWLPARMKKKIRSESMIGTFCNNWGATLDAAKDFLRAIIPEYLIATAQSDTLDRLSRFRQTYRELGETDESLRTRTMIAYETKRKDGTIPGMEGGLAGLGYTVTVSEPNKGTDHWSRFVISVTAWDGVVADIGYFFALVTRMKPAHTRALIESALEECLFDDWEDGIDDPLLFDEGYFDDWLPD